MIEPYLRFSTRHLSKILNNTLSAVKDGLQKFVGGLTSSDKMYVQDENKSTIHTIGRSFNRGRTV